MPTRQKLVTFGIPTAAAATIVLAASLSPWSQRRDSAPRVPLASGHQIDVVFAVDTTGSMGGLIDGAKRTVWSIANHIKKTDPNADIRIGLVAYRDVTDDYVTRPFALTTDLDAVFAELSSYEASGGGDNPEHVAAALDVTLHAMQWRGDAKKLVFVVGDAPPAERDDGLRFEDLAREASTKRIIINTIRAGGSDDTARAFQYMASLANGEFSSIQQDGGVQQIATPYDDKLAALSARIDNTAIIAGDEGVRMRYQAKRAAAEAAPAESKADRASYYAQQGGLGRSNDDLVGSYATGADLGAVDPGALPADMRGLDKDALKQELDRRVAERKTVQQEIDALVKQRDAYLKGQAAEGGGGAAFDTAVKATVEKQLLD